jgi:hypothetical protein
MDSNRITISLWRDRKKEGFLLAEKFSNGSWAKVFECPALGNADNALTPLDPTDNPTKKFGDTPFGRYAPTVFSVFEGVDPKEYLKLHRDTSKRLDHTLPGVDRKFGPGFAPLIPDLRFESDAKVGWLNGRRGLGIHGGRSQSALVATGGCIRIFNRDYLELHEAFDGKAVTVIVKPMGGAQ